LPTPSMFVAAHNARFGEVFKRRILCYTFEMNTDERNALRRLANLPLLDGPTEAARLSAAREEAEFHRQFEIEIDWPDVETLDRSRIPEMKLLTEFAEQNEEGLAASLYLDRPHLKRRAR
jgi:hypothetical protein